MTPSQMICCVLGLAYTPIFLGGAIAQRDSTKTTPIGIMGFVLFFLHLESEQPSVCCCCLFCCTHCHWTLLFCVVCVWETTKERIHIRYWSAAAATAVVVAAWWWW